MPPIKKYTFKHKKVDNVTINVHTHGDVNHAYCLLIGAVRNSTDFEILKIIKQMTLEQRFKNETGEDAYYTDQTLYNNYYIEWLEDLVKQSESKNIEHETKRN